MVQWLPRYGPTAMIRPTMLKSEKCEVSTIVALNGFFEFQLFLDEC